MRILRYYGPLGSEQQEGEIVEFLGPAGTKQLRLSVSGLDKALSAQPGQATHIYTSGLTLELNDVGLTRNCAQEMGASHVRSELITA